MPEKMKPDESQAPEPRPRDELARIHRPNGEHNGPSPGHPGGPPFQVAGKVSLTRS